MDAHERAMTRAYNKAVKTLSRLPEGDPRHIRAAAKAAYWKKAIEKYQRSRNN